MSQRDDDQESGEYIKQCATRARIAVRQASVVKSHEKSSRGFQEVPLLSKKLRVSSLPFIETYKYVYSHIGVHMQTSIWSLSNCSKNPFIHRFLVICIVLGAWLCARNTFKNICRPLVHVIWHYKRLMQPTYRGTPYAYARRRVVSALHTTNAQLEHSAELKS